jgi:amidase
MTDLAFQSATDLVASIKKQEISAAELLDYYLERIERLNPALNAVVATDAAAARERAAAADKDLSQGRWRGPLHGLPMTIKDAFEVSGMPCTSGAPMLKNYIPIENADGVQSLIDAGAIVVGKTNMPLYGADIQTYNDVYGQTNNPWDPTRTPGGSSGGAAAAVAAGLCGLDLGSDIGGSIRTPAHFCGIYGHKPSFGIVPDRGHIPPPPGIFSGCHSMEVDIVTNGPLARSADDLMLALDILVRPERAERRAWRIELPPPRKKQLSEYRIGVWLDDPACPVDTAVGDILQQAVDVLARAGATIDNRRPEINFSDSHDVFLSLLAAVMGSGVPQPLFDQWLKAVPGLTKDDSYRAKHIKGATQLHHSWIRQDLFRQLLRQKWEDFFQDCDALICPVVTVPALKHDHSKLEERTVKVNGRERPYWDLMGWAGLSGVVYLPATVAPAGITADGLPVGLQIVGPYLEDRTPIHIARLMADVVGGFTPPPRFDNNDGVGNTLGAISAQSTGRGDQRS